MTDGAVQTTQRLELASVQDRLNVLLSLEKDVRNGADIRDTLLTLISVQIAEARSAAGSFI